MKKSVRSTMVILMTLCLFASSNNAVASKTIRFWSDQEEPWQQKVISAMILDFESSNPGLKVEVEYISFKDRHAKMTAALAAGDVPEVALLSSQYATSLPAQGALRKIDDVVREFGGPDAFAGTSLSLARYKGSFYSLPYSMIPVVIWYRIDRFQENGLKIPETMEEFYNATRILSETGKGKYFALGVPFGRGEFTDETFRCLGLWPLGGTVFDSTMKVAFNSPATIKALEFYKSLYPFTPPGSEKWEYADTMKSFVSGSCAMTVYFGRTLKNLEMFNPGILAKTGAFLPPKGIFQRTVNPTQSIGVFGNSRNPEDGVKFLKFFFTSRHYVDFLWSTPGHSIPTLKSKVNAWRKHELLKKYPEIMNVLLRACEADIGFSPTKPPGNPVASPAWQAIRGSHVIPDAVQKTTLKNEDPKAVAEWAQQELEAIVERHKM